LSAEGPQTPSYTEGRVGEDREVKEGESWGGKGRAGRI